MANLMRLSKEKLERLLIERLDLKDPVLLLRKYDGQWVGNIISPSFKRKGDYQRQVMVWDTLEAEFGNEANRLVGMLLCYTPDEWNLDADTALVAKKKKKAG
jgi:acid stress-induced BolA-like protein IbaG/YrbA